MFINKGKKSGLVLWPHWLNKNLSGGFTFIIINNNCTYEFCACDIIINADNNHSKTTIGSNKVPAPPTDIIYNNHDQNTNTSIK